MVRNMILMGKIKLQKVADWLIDWLTDWLAGWLAGWLSEWTNDWQKECDCNLKFQIQRKDVKNDEKQENIIKEYKERGTERVNLAQA